MKRTTNVVRFLLYRKFLLTEKSRNKNARARPGELKEDYGIGKI